MNFDPNILFNNEVEEKHIEPDRIFAGLIKQQEYEYLRGVQTEILEEWFTRRKDKDIILKMNTGAGKTLVGLLILQSALNEGCGPAVYLCPDYQLVEQVMKKAMEYGIKCVKFDKTKTFPQEFLNCEAILVAVFDMVFNGQSKFDRYGIDVGTIIMDDAHSCISKTREKFTIKLSRELSEYNQLFKLFENDLKRQDLGASKDIELGYDLVDVMQVPHWAWSSKIDTVVSILSDGASKGKTSKLNDLIALYFTWPLLKKNIESCFCFISTNYIEITPFCIPVKQVKTFYNAKRRIFMSATLLDDSLLIKELDVSEDAVLNPLKNKMYYNIGERMILLPSLLHNSLNYETIPALCKMLADEGKNSVILVSTFHKKVVKRWEDVGADIAKSGDIVEKVENLNKSNNNLLVLANRYDGIDLKGNQCRVLVIDGLPAGANLYEKYCNDVRPSSKILRSIQSQRIEQGIGRSTRSSNDYSVVIIIGTELVTFMSMNENKVFLSPQTKMQVEIGLNFSKKIKIDENNAVDALYSLIKTSLDRNINWIKFHNNQVQKAIEETYSFLPIEITKAERMAYELFNSNRAMEASDYLNKIINENIKKLHSDDIGWLMQIVSAYMFKANGTKSMEQQIKAHEYNSLLCKAPEGIKYKKLYNKNELQVNRVLYYAKNFNEPNALIMHVDEIISNLNFGIKAELFERSWYKVGKVLGFETQRPEKEFRKGCDVLWHMTNNQYIIFEAKNEVKEEREYIYKSDAEQITNSLNWFRNDDYVGESGVPIIIHPTIVCANDAFPDESVLVMDKEKLDLFLLNLKGFISEVAVKVNTEFIEQEIGELLSAYSLNPNDITRKYTKHFTRI